MRIDDEVLKVLARADCVGNALRLTGKLDRALYTKVNKVLEACGGKWDRRSEAHMFDGPAEDAVERAVLTGEVVTVKTQFGEFFTPAPVADRAIKKADLKPNLVVLEPSAGVGALALRAKAAGCTVMCVELQEKNAAKLVAAGLRSVLIMDFLALEPVSTRVDRVVMNPPFAKRADVHHILHAAKFLKPGGRLVAIASASVLLRSDGLATRFREFVRDRNGEIEPLPDEAFRSSGTLVKTAMVSFNA